MIGLRFSKKKFDFMLANFLIILYSFTLSFILFKINFFLPIDFDTAMQITKLYHNEVWDSYPHHQFIVFYYSIFFNLFSFIENEYSRFLIIFFIHYSFALIILWNLIQFLSKNLFLNLIYFISISISGIFLYLILTQEDCIITLPFYFLSFYLFLLFYESKKALYLIFSASLSGFSTSINSSDFFLSFSIGSFFITMTFYSFFKKDKKEFQFYLKNFINYFLFFSITLLALLMIKSLISKISFFTILQQTFLSPYEIYRNVLGEYGINIQRVIKTFNSFSYILLQEPKLLEQFYLKVLIYDLIIFFVLFHLLFQIRNYKPFIVTIFLLGINFYLLLTSDENAINERFINSFFIFLIILRTKRLLAPIFFSILFFISTFNLKNYSLQKETKDIIHSISTKNKSYISIYYFYNPSILEKYNLNQIDKDGLLRSSSGPILGLSNMILNNDCWLYNPYSHIPYIPKNCKNFNNLNEIPLQLNRDFYIDPYLLELKNNVVWNCSRLSEFLKECNQKLKNYIPKKFDFFSEKFTSNSCDYFDPECSQKIQFSCNYLYYCKKW